MAKCYTKLGQKTRAWRALQEAVKCNYDNWKIWDNLMVVSIDCCEYEEVYRKYLLFFLCALRLKNVFVGNTIIQPHP